MIAKLRSWWQEIKAHPVATIFITLLAVIFVLFALSILGYIFNWGWTGLVQYSHPNKDILFQPAKTLWDWLQLLIIPLVLAVAALLFNLANSRTERQIAKERYEQDRQIALDKQREDLLQAYLDRMSELLLNKQLRTSEPDSEVRNVARARTLTVLSQLDAQRKGNLMQFLSESKLLEIINLSGANLSGAYLSDADLNGAVLSHADLSGANLFDATLNGADLSVANLSEATLRGATLRGANLSGAYLRGATLVKADLSDADLRGATLSGAYLNGADLGRANLSFANLDDADLIGAYLRGADLSGALLANAKNIEGLEMQAKSLKGAHMPDGSEHP